MNHITSIKLNGRTRLIPDEGYRVTDGKDIFSLCLILNVGADESPYYAITEEMYQQIMADREAELIARGGMI